MRLDRIKAYLIDLLVIFIIYTLINALVPQSDDLKRYKAAERELHENYIEQKVSFNEYIDNYEIIYYNISAESKVNNILYLVCVILYFVVLPYFLNGQTLGLFLNKLRIEKFTDGKLHIHNYLIRNIVIVGLGYTIFNTLLIYFVNEKMYYKVLLIVSFIQILLLVLSWITVLLKKEKRGLHEIFSNTEMVSLRNKKN